MDSGDFASRETSDEVIVDFVDCHSDHHDLRFEHLTSRSKILLENQHAHQHESFFPFGGTCSITLQHSAKNRRGYALVYREPKRNHKNKEKEKEGERERESFENYQKRG